MRLASLQRRLMGFVYEGVVLFGVLMATGTVYALATNQRHALQGRDGLMLTLFLTLAVYFVGFWTHGGQTLPMKTWRMRLVSRQGERVTPWQACRRYLAAWLWFLPPWLGVKIAGGHQLSAMVGSTAAWMLAYIALTRILPQGQFLHDQLAGTQLLELDGQGSGR